MLVLIGKSKLFLARLASPARRASEIGWLSDSLFVLSLCKKFFNQFIFKLTQTQFGRVHHIPGPY